MIQDLGQMFNGGSRQRLVNSDYRLEDSNRHQRFRKGSGGWAWTIIKNIPEVVPSVSQGL